jgi:hypothetical protein
MDLGLCVVIASHISNPKRIEYLQECLLSLCNQSKPADIYVSISFENNGLMNSFLDLILDLHFPKTPVIRIREKKTPQMRHMALLLEEIEKRGNKWILFCDDDDTYHIHRIEIFENFVKQGLLECDLISERTLGGVYESTFNKFHNEHRHEYWCYCVSLPVFRRFFEVIAKHDDVLDDKCCDVVFAEYLRRSGGNLAFGRITDSLYNYRIENNSDSITGVIQYRQKNEIRVPNPPSPENEEALRQYVLDFNNYLNENLDIYLHDTYLRTIVGLSFDDILQKEFTFDYPLLPYVNQEHLIKLNNYWERLRGICNELYDIKI